MIAALNNYFYNIPCNMIHSDSALMKGPDIAQAENAVVLPRFLVGRDSEQYERILNTIFVSSTEDSGKIDFESDSWDFYPLVKDGIKHLLKIKQLIQEHNKNEHQVPLREPDLLIVLTGGSMAYTRADGVKVIPLGCLKD